MYLWSWLTSRRHVRFRPNTFFSGVNPAGCCTSELNRIWQTLQEMTGRLVLISGTPKVWFMTAFCTGSICWGNDSGGEGNPLVVNLRKSATITTTRVEALTPKPARLASHRGATRSESTTLSASALEPHRWLEASRAHIVPGEEFKPKQPK